MPPIKGDYVCFVLVHHGDGRAASDHRLSDWAPRRREQRGAAEEQRRQHLGQVHMTSKVMSNV